LDLWGILRFALPGSGSRRGRVCANKPDVGTPNSGQSSECGESTTINLVNVDRSAVDVKPHEPHRHAESAVAQTSSLSVTPPAQVGGYELLEVLGSGGMGVVTKAFDTKLRRVVAVKTLSSCFSSHPQSRSRFLREAQVAASVHHDNVVAIYGIEDQAEMPFLVMEYVPGKSLQQRIDESGPMPVADVLRIGRQIAAGLAAAHGNGVVHRDIKPANILLDATSNRVKITDFGLARAVSDIGMTQVGQVAGTPQYMSPEQAQGQVVDRRSDLFSLGSLMYAMLTGVAPFQGDSAVAILRRVCDERPTPVARLRPDVPEAVCNTIERLMAKRSEKRFQTADEVEHVLTSILMSVGREDSIPDSTYRGRNWIGIQGMLVTAILLMAALLVSGNWKSRSAREVNPSIRASDNSPERTIGSTVPAVPAATSEVRSSRLVPSAPVESISTDEWKVLIQGDEPASTANRQGIAEWNVSEGVLRGEADQSLGQISLCSSAPLEFQLRGEVRSKGPGNSGFDILLSRDGHFLQGYQLDISGADAGRSAQIAPWTILSRESVPIQSGEWFPVEITKTSSYLRYKVKENYLPSVPIPPCDQIEIQLEANGKAGLVSVDVRDLRIRKIDSQTSVLSMPGFALQFDGQSSYATVPDLICDSRADSTIEAWVCPEVQSHSQVVVLYCGQSYQQIGKSNNGLFGLVLECEAMKASDNPRFIPGEWNHVAVVSTEREVRMYFNGAIVATMPRHDVPKLNPHTFRGLWIGAHPFDRDTKEIGYFYLGQLDEIRISGVARYEADFSPQKWFEPDVHTLGLYHCDEGTGAELLDSSGNNRHGQVVQVKWVSQSSTK
jgi:serine/threonine protein kinase